MEHVATRAETGGRPRRASFLVETGSHGEDVRRCRTPACPPDDCVSRVAVLSAPWCSVLCAVHASEAFRGYRHRDRPGHPLPGRALLPEPDVSLLGLRTKLLCPL